uniref:B30.2/SPRY domain-containing protein n=1 Tax=Podarcis muralis TaxID=64176 RepID=A0A670HZS5_PODMU
TKRLTRKLQPLPSAYIVEEARCPLCKEYFTDPVSVDCGHSFCWGCIKEHVVNWNVLWTLRCPVCSAVLQKGKFRANWQLANIVERIKLLGLSLTSLSFPHNPTESPTEHITLDPDTAHPNLILSEDHKSLRWGDECQERPDNPERFDKTPFVLGREGFTSGRHFWDFAVGSDGGWAVGVTRKSLSRKGVLSLNSKEGIWAVGKLGSRYSATNNPHYSPLTLSGELKRIRVFLNVEGGRVAFFDADSGVPLFTFSGASFSGETLLPLVFLRDKAHLTLSPGDGKLSLTGQDDIALLGS